MNNKTFILELSCAICGRAEDYNVLTEYNKSGELIVSRTFDISCDRCSFPFDKGTVEELLIDSLANE